MRFKDDEHTSLVTVGQIDLKAGDGIQAIDNNALPLLPTRNLVLFPGVTIPLSLVRPSTLATAQAAAKNQTPIGIVCQLNPDVDSPALSDLSKYGVVANVMKVFELPDGSHTAVVVARSKFKIIGNSVDADNNETSGLVARVSPVSDRRPAKNDKEFPIMVQQINDLALSIIKKSLETPDEMATMIEGITSSELLINTVASHLPFSSELKQEMLAKHLLKERAFLLLGALQQSEQRVDLTRDILARTRQNMDVQQRNAFLQQQIETLREELYGSDDELSALEKRAKNVEFPEAVRSVFNKEIEKLRRSNPQSPEYGVSLNYVETLLDLPWSERSPLNTDFELARQTLNNDHYGLDKVKDRILEQIAVLMNNPDGHAPILCLVGAPGVGKTSLGQSVARALGRAYQRVSLGGLHDEAEIRGHRRTYIGAMPGRIVEAMRRAKTVNPVLLLDEVDKIGADFKGDPSAALLEVLDPEQNCHFHDNFIDVDYDLSQVLFIATANTLTTLSQPLLDRMEVIDISGYLVEEKIQIARRHLLPRVLAQHRLSDSDVSITDDAIEHIVDSYTSESGVRQLEKKLSSIVRKVVLKRVSGDEYPNVISEDDLKDFLGVPIYQRDKYEGNDFAGVVTGLAWTSVGGEILFIESSLSKGKGEKVTLTGNLGDVMKESAIIALQYVKAHADILGIDPEMFEQYQLHVHVPEGAIPKDGPSAGITMATSIISAFTRRKVRPRLAMTGEITLRGKVLPVGGIKEKILAAKRAGITDIVLSSDNRKDVMDISEIYVSGLNFHYVNTVMDVVSIAITDQKACI